MNTKKWFLTLAACLMSTSVVCGQLTVTTAGRGSQLYSSDADLVTGTRRNAGFGDDAISLTQTFQSSSAITLQSFAILYEYEIDDRAIEPNSVPITIEIFEVADVSVDTLVVGAELLNFTFSVGSFPDNGQQGEALFTLDTAIPLAAATGTEGYGIRISGGTGDGTRGFEWGRSTASAGGSIFADGRAYDNDGVVGFGNSDTPERDMSLSLNPVPCQAGDFDADCVVDLLDLDDYNNFINDDDDAATPEVSVISGLPAAGILAALDLTGDGTVDETDFVLHYETMVETSNGQVGTFAGDANLDGTVDVLGDAFILVSNLGLQGQDDEGDDLVTSWDQGDFNADRVVNVLGDAFLLVANLGNTNEP
ncbi:hypothetical protein N9L06_02080 [Mariniblastus sp.]|nr:hypothetical protein [Mariniblastus sp.]